MTRDLKQGLILFFLIKLLLISFGFASKEGPRLGDDALVYLYYAETPLNARLTEVGPSSLREMAETFGREGAGPAEKLMADRVLMRVAGERGTSLLWVHALFDHSKLGFYTSFWLQELLTLIVLTAGLGALLSRMEGLRRLKIGLPMVALAFLPGQGLHFMIPSIMALGFGMLVWAAALSHRIQPIALVLFSMLALLTHGIGMAHVAVAGCLIVLRVLVRQINLNRGFIECGYLVVGFAGYLLLATLFNAKGGVAYDFTRIGLSVIAENLAGLPARYESFLQEDPVSGILFPVGLFFLVSRRSSNTKSWLPTDPLKQVALALGVMTLGTHLYIIDGYPSEVPLRFATVLMAIGLIVFSSELRLQRPFRWNWIWIGLLAVYFPLNGFVRSVDNRDQRWPEIERQELAAFINSLAPKEPIFYLDEDFALVSGFIAAGVSRPAVASSLLALDPELARAWVKEFPPSAAISLVPRSFRTERRLAWSLFDQARYGFDLVSGGQVILKSQTPPTSLGFGWQGEAPPVLTLDGGAICALTTENDLLILSDPTCLGALANEGLQLSGRGMLVGLALPGQSNCLSWPWGAELSLEYLPVRTLVHQGRPTHTTFALGEGSQLDLPQDLIDELLRDMVPIRDQGGVVVMRRTTHLGAERDRCTQ